jgi:CBS domain containing-hemolysin-like protein
LNLKIVLSFIFIINFIFIAHAYAYIDPNTGGFFFQTVAPFVYGILGVIVVFWKRILGFVKGLLGSEKISDNSKKDS